jgi:hypothetical protein
MPSWSNFSPGSRIKLQHHEQERDLDLEDESSDEEGSEFNRMQAQALHPNASPAVALEAEREIEAMHSTLEYTNEHNGMPPLKQMEQEALKVRDDLNFESHPLQNQGIESAQGRQIQPSQQQYPTYEAPAIQSQSQLQAPGPPLFLGLAVVGGGFYYATFVMPQQQERREYSVIPGI